MLNTNPTEPADHECENEPSPPPSLPHLPPAPQTPKDDSDFVSRALQGFINTRALGSESTHFLACKHCRGDILDL
ncbi:unnamed protein product [Dibothriocephalus latus]|uniref:Uncharacterized protein n=1 Tax=Dibothriocephalus latus TaxID=60516 RepID=A0A3P7M2F8_DIBLA|nr:unnamed protein product [Dibothriocephalus latus]